MNEFCPITSTRIQPLFSADLPRPDDGTVKSYIDETKTGTGSDDGVKVDVSKQDGRQASGAQPETEVDVVNMVGITVGIVVIFLLLVLIIVFVRRRSRKNASAQMMMHPMLDYR